MATIYNGSGAVFPFTLKDEDEVQLTLAGIASITMTLFDLNTGGVINSRQGQDILNANNVTIASNGSASFAMQPEDNPIINPKLQTEIHRMAVRWVTTLGIHGTGKFDIPVVNLKDR